MSAPAIVLRPGQATDLPLLQAFDPFAGRRDREIEEGLLQVAARQNEVLAYLTFSRGGFVGNPYIEFLAVAPSGRRQGLASRLLAWALAQHPGLRVFISTEADNFPMRALLQAGPWTEAGAVHGANGPRAAEVFFYTDVPSLVLPPARS